MTTKYLSGTYSGGYALSASYSGLHVGSSASVGGAGVYAGNPATITNSGTIASAVNSSGTEAYAGINLAAGEVINYGAITGGNRNQTVSGELGGKGVEIHGAAMVANYGQITGGAGQGPGAGATGGAGVYFYGAGTLTNNAGAITGGAGRLVGGTGFDSIGDAYLTNDAMIQGGLGAGGHGGYGAAFQNNATIVNAGAIVGGTGLAGNRGGVGVYVSGSGTLTNSGTILGGAGGAVSGGAENAAGVILLHGGSVANTGAIDGGGAGGEGVILPSGGMVTNGAVGNSTASIVGVIGVQVGGGNDGISLNGPGTVTNYGLIEGTGGVSVLLGEADDRVIAEAGSSFVGQIVGDGGTLELAGGSGDIGGLGGAGTLSGAVRGGFSGFAAYVIDAGGDWVLGGANTLLAGQSLKVAGTLLTAAGASLDNDGKLKVDGGAVTIDGPVTGSGKVKIIAGAIAFGSSFSENVTFGGPTGTLTLAQSQGYKAAITGFSLTGGTSLDLQDIGFVNVHEATFTGTASGGTLKVTDGVHTAEITLVGDYLGSTFTAASDGVGGTIVTDPAAEPSTHRFVAAMAGLGSPAPISSRAADEQRLAALPGMFTPRGQAAA